MAKNTANLSDLQGEGKAYTYVRCSEGDERTGSCTLEWQRNTILTWTKAHERRWEREYVDNGVTAAIPLESRPQGKRLVAEVIHAGDIIVVAKLDRLFRDVEDFRARLRVWHTQGVLLVSADGGLDLTTPMGRFFATLQAAFSEYEREVIAERTVAAIETRKATGLRHSTEPLYGWRHVPFGPPRKDGSRECRVEPNDKEQWVINRIVKLRSDHLGYRSIANELTRAHIPTRRGGPWSHSTIADILRTIDEHLAPSDDHVDRPHDQHDRESTDGAGLEGDA